MSDDISVSYSYSPTSAPAVQPSENAGSEPQVAFADCELIPVNEQVMLVINRQNGNQQLIAPQVVEALKTCTQFDTIRSHTARLCATRPELKNQESLVMQTLQNLRDAGFLLDAQLICARLGEKVEKKLAPTRVFIITCDRPGCVERLLESMLRAGGLTRHDGLWLIDDSRKPENQAANRELVEKFNVTSAKTMRYFGRDAQDALIAELIAILPQHENGIRFLIDPEKWGDTPTYGRSRTLGLLLSVDSRAIVLDDDILCQAMRPVIEKDGVFIGSGGEREAAFFPNRDTLMSVAVPAQESPLDIHARYLGAPLGTAVQELNHGALNPVQLATANAAMTNIWRADSPVLVTQCGSWGDPGTGDAHWIQNLNRDSIERMLALDEGMATAIEARCVWLGTVQPTVVKMAFMSQMTGLDNSALLPPYFPVFRGEDLLFASMVEAMHPRGAVIEHNFAVPHLPETRQRKSLRDPIATSGSVGLFAAYLTNRIDYTDGNDPGHRLSILAQDFRRLADKADNDLVLDYRREVAKGHAVQLMHIRNQLAQSKNLDSANWTGYLTRAQEEVRAAIEKTWSPTDIDGVPTGTDESTLMNQLRELLRGYADALDGWEAMREVAQKYTG